MSKIVIPFNKSKMSMYLQRNIPAFIIGVDKFSENFKYLLKYDELIEYINLISENNREVFIDLNKLYFNNEINDLKSFLINLDKYSDKITGIMFSDMSIINIVKENNLKLNLVWDARHLGTNSYTINFLEKRGITGALISNEITLLEKIDIKKKTNVNIFVTLFGYINIATSSRSLLSNYFEFNNKKYEKGKKYFITDKVHNDKLYPIIESDNTNFFSDKILNGLRYLPTLIENDIDYIYLDDYMIFDNIFINVLDSFIEAKNGYKDENFILKVNTVINSNISNNNDDLFLNKKSVFRVKDYE
jgi:collagenase-like PrtC family protease